MNIFYTQTAYPPSIGGAQAYLHGLATQLAGTLRGPLGTLPGPRHKVQVAAFWASNRTDWLLGTTWFAPGGAPYAIDGIPVSPIRFSAQERARMSAAVAGYYLSQRRAIRHLAVLLLPHLRQIASQMPGGPEIIHHGRVGREPLAFASLALARELAIPFVLTPFHHPRWRGRLYHNYHWLYRQADAVLALTPAEKETLIGLGVSPARIFVTGTGAVLSPMAPAGVQSEPFRRKHDISGPMVLFLGQKYGYKGFNTLLEAAPLVWQKQPDTHFVFLGPRTRASRRVFGRITDPRVVELGAVSLEEKTSALAACELLCVPSTQESFGAVYVEAWQMGKPVIAADIAAVSHVIDDAVDGFLGPVDRRFLADKIVLLLSDPARRAAMGAAGQRKAQEQYGWPVLASRTEEIYRSLAEQ